MPLIEQNSHIDDQTLTTHLSSTNSYYSTSILPNSSLLAAMKPSYRRLLPRISTSRRFFASRFGNSNGHSNSYTNSPHPSSTRSPSGRTSQSFQDQLYREEVEQEVMANRERRKREIEALRKHAARFEAQEFHTQNGYQHPTSHLPPTPPVPNSSSSANKKSSFTADKGNGSGAQRLGSDFHNSHGNEASAYGSELYEAAGQTSKTSSNRNTHMRRPYGTPKTSQLHRYNKTLSPEDELQRRIAEVADQYADFPRYRQIIAMDVKMQMEEDGRQGVSTYPRQPMPKVPSFEEFADVNPPLSRSNPSVFKATVTENDPTLQRMRKGQDIPANPLGLKGTIPDPTPAQQSSTTATNTAGKNGKPEPKSMIELMNRYNRISNSQVFREEVGWEPDYSRR